MECGIEGDIGMCRGIYGIKGDVGSKRLIGDVV